VNLSRRQGPKVDQKGCLAKDKTRQGRIGSGVVKIYGGIFFMTLRVLSNLLTSSFIATSFNDAVAVGGAW
jgi:hypothetical protein